MVIEINKFGGSPAIGVNEQQQAQGINADKGGHPPAGEPAGTADKVSLTSSAQRLQELEARVRAMPAADAERIEETRMRLDNGTYTVRPGVVAEKVIEMDSVLPNT